MNTRMASDDGDCVVEFGDMFPDNVDIDLGMKKHTTSQQRLQRLQQSKATSNSSFYTLLVVLLVI